MKNKKTNRIRTACDADAAAISRLLKQLEYNVSIEETQKRVANIKAAGGNVFVATDAEGRTVGCVQALKELRLAEGEFAELVSLVVDQDCRKMGLGGQLIRAVETWCMEQGISCLRIRSNSKRTAALHFYANAGFTPKKEQTIFEKRLDI